MSRSASAPREIAMPASVFDSLREELEKETNTLLTVRALHRAGYQAGVGAAASVDREAGGNALGLGQGAFWSHLSGYFAKRGWGSLAHSSPHRAVGVVTSHDWAEANPTSDDADATCSFSTGFLSGLLSQLAGGAVAVLEVRCRSRGDASCDFAFGSETAIHELYGILLEDGDLDRAFEAL